MNTVVYLERAVDGEVNERSLCELVKFAKFEGMIRRGWDRGRWRRRSGSRWEDLGLSFGSQQLL
jgi:hypothetical protein